MQFFRHFIAALRFLTIIPFPGTIGTAAEDLQGALPYFGFVGIVIGGLSGLAAWFLWNLFPPMVAAVLLTIVLFSFSGAMHLDGLADCADGFFSSRKREQVLEIMRDSRVGVMGVVALIMTLMLKVAVLAQLDMRWAIQAALLIPVGGRAALVLMIFLLSYVRPEGGMGSMFYVQGSGWALTITLVLFFGSFVVVLGYAGMIIASIIMIVVFLFSRYCQRKIGGATGDTIGAASEIAETIALLGILLFYLQQE